MKVADLYAGLDIRPNKAGIAQGNRLISGMKKALIGLAAGLAAGAIVKGFKNLFTDVSKTADRFNKLAVQVGISSEQLQGLEFSSELAGTSFEALNKGLLRMSRSITDARDGLKSAKEPLEELLGKELANKVANMDDMHEALFILADGFAAMPAGMRKASIAQDLFGKSGVGLLNLLDGGSESLRANQKELEKLGAIISTKTGSAFESVNDDMLRVSKAWKGFKIQIASAMLPTVQRVTKGIVTWAKANQELIRQKIQAFMDGLIKGAKGAWKLLVAVVDVMTPLIEAAWGLGKAILDLVGGWDGFIEILKLSFLPLTLTIKGVTALVNVMKDLVQSTLEYLGLRVKLFEGVDIPNIDQVKLDLQRQGKIPLELGGLPEIPGAPAPVRARRGRGASTINQSNNFKTTINATPDMNERDIERRVNRTVKKELDRQIRTIDLSTLPEF